MPDAHSTHNGSLRRLCGHAFDIIMECMASAVRAALAAEYCERFSQKTRGSAPQRIRSRAVGTP
jgi:hypothetical protein